MVSRRMVLGFDRQRQGLNGAHMQTRHLFAMQSLGFHTSQVEAVAAIKQVGERHHQHGDLPREPALEGMIEAR